jgi:hypothetical protein
MQTLQVPSFYPLCGHLLILGQYLLTLPFPSGSQRQVWRSSGFHIISSQMHLEGQPYCDLALKLPLFPPHTGKPTSGTPLSIRLPSFLSSVFRELGETVRSGKCPLHARSHIWFLL